MDELQLRERLDHLIDLIDLDTPLTKVVPLDLTGLHVIDGVDRTGELTVGQALAHTTGLPRPTHRPTPLDPAPMTITPEIRGPRLA